MIARTDRGTKMPETSVTHSTPALRSESGRRRSGATKALAEALQQGRTAVKTLDAVVSHLIMGNAGLTAEWRNAQRVTKATGARRTSDISPVPAAGTAPTATPQTPAHQTQEVPAAKAA